MAPPPPPTKGDSAGEQPKMGDNPAVQSNLITEFLKTTIGEAQKIFSPVVQGIDTACKYLVPRVISGDLSLAKLIRASESPNGSAGKPSGGVLSTDFPIKKPSINSKSSNMLDEHILVNKEGKKAPSTHNELKNEILSLMLTPSDRDIGTPSSASNQSSVINQSESSIPPSPASNPTKQLGSQPVDNNPTSPALASSDRGIGTPSSASNQSSVINQSESSIPPSPASNPTKQLGSQPVDNNPTSPALASSDRGIGTPSSASNQSSVINQSESSIPPSPASNPTKQLGSQPVDNDPTSPALASSDRGIGTPSSASNQSSVINQSESSIPPSPASNPTKQLGSQPVDNNPTSPALASSDRGIGTPSSASNQSSVINQSESSIPPSPASNPTKQLGSQPVDNTNSIDLSTTKTALADSSSTQSTDGKPAKSSANTTDVLTSNNTANGATSLEKAKAADQQTTVASNTDSTQTQPSTSTTKPTDKITGTDQTNVASATKPISGTDATQLSKSSIAGNGTDTTNPVIAQNRAPGLDGLTRAQQQNADTVGPGQSVVLPTQLVIPPIDHLLQSQFGLARNSATEQSITSPLSLFTTASAGAMKATDAVVVSGKSIESGKNIQIALNDQNMRALVQDLNGLKASLQMAQGAPGTSVSGEGKLPVPRGGNSLSTETIATMSGIKTITGTPENMGSVLLPMSNIRLIIPTGKSGEIADTIEPSKLPTGSNFPPGSMATANSTGAQGSGQAGSGQTIVNKDPKPQNNGSNIDPNATDTKSLIARLPHLTITGIEPRPEISTQFDFDNINQNNGSLDFSFNPETRATAGGSGGSTTSSNQIDVDFNKLRQVLAILSLFAWAVMLIVEGKQLLQKADIEKAYKKKISEPTEHTVQPGEALFQISESNYGDPNFAKTLYHQNVKRNANDGKPLDPVENEDDLEAIKNIQPKPGTVLTILSKSDIQLLEIAQQNQCEALLSVAQFKNPVNKPGIPIDALIPVWIRKTPSLFASYRDLALELICSMNSKSVAQMFETMMVYMIKKGYITEHKGIDKNMSSPYQYPLKRA